MKLALVGCLLGTVWHSSGPLRSPEGVFPHSLSKLLYLIWQTCWNLKNVVNTVLVLVIRVSGFCRGLTNAIKFEQLSARFTFASTEMFAEYGWKTSFSLLYGGGQATSILHHGRRINAYMLSIHHSQILFVSQREGLSNKKCANKDTSSVPPGQKKCLRQQLSYLMVHGTQPQLGFLTMFSLLTPRPNNQRFLKRCL